ncbi:MAG: GTP cyclohydrolase FolE2 [Desulfovibrionaceae bacterium]
MEDVQSGKAAIALPIDRVGVKDLRLPIIVRDRATGSQHTVARVDLSVDLPAEFKGTHMSRFVEALEHWSEELDYGSFKRLLADITERLHAQRAYAELHFPFFVLRSAPASGGKGMMGYDCSLVGEYEKGHLVFTLGVEAPVMTVCPCSLAISDNGAHSQRAVVRVKARFTGLLWLEDLIDICESAGSSPVYSLLKREDEKFVTEAAFANPAFVEDVVRSVALGLADHPQVTWFRAEVESLESIHNHSAYASIERNLEKR